ncbi:hypothetical protein LCGC14_1423730 [marine sediment metagenome]|uniref:Uncharacterized protein n=1 Tax=marine sediment metagenome TaxID=412755 RepID=A0A0F9M613_9ZZZZ
MATETKKQTDYNKLVGRQGDTYYYLDYVFDHGPGSSFRGAVGSRMCPVTFADAERRRENFDEDGDEWRAAVQEQQTTLGYDDWCKFVVATDGDDAIFDQSYSDTYGEDLLDRLDPEREEYELVECTGGGRCFNHEDKWDEVFDAELVKVIASYESK